MIIRNRPHVRISLANSATGVQFHLPDMSILVKINIFFCISCVSRVEKSEFRNISQSCQRKYVLIANSSFHELFPCSLMWCEIQTPSLTNRPVLRNFTYINWYSRVFLLSRARNTRVYVGFTELRATWRNLKNISCHILFCTRRLTKQYSLRTLVVILW